MRTAPAVPSPAAQARGRSFVSQLAGRLGERVVVHGWLAAVRRARGVRFLALRDRSGSVQVVWRGDDEAGDAGGLTPESAVTVTGVVRTTASARFGTIEIDAETVEVVARAETPLPLDGRPDAEARLDHRHLDLRARQRFLVFEVQTTLEAAVRRFLAARGFVEIHTPKITAGGSESGAAVFELSYGGQPACLAQSPQFYMQLAMAAGFDRAFEVGPVFRAESAVTNRHATEFTCIDVEMSWIDSPEELMAFEEELLGAALAAVRDVHGDDVERHCGLPVEVPESPIPRVPLEAAARLVGGTDAGGGAGGRLTHRAEQALSRHVRERHGHGLVFVTGYPAAERPFYTMREDGRPAITRSFDLLWRGIEVTSGCQREHRAGRLRAQAVEAGLDTGTLARYLDAHYFPLFRHGCPPHGGFGIGLNRLLMALLGQPSVRETSFVFRGPGRFVP